ncbi:MAG: CBS domain-containing protein [Candidatus Lokiarchaeota archaeon]|nr:CBS domain-containing protein [Candidatus Lokiarchaeota archaeon]
MSDYLFESGETEGTDEFPLKDVSKKSVYYVFLCYFDEKRGHLPLYTYPNNLKFDEEELKIIKIHSIWFLDAGLSDNLQHVDLDYHDRIYLAIKFTGKSWREKTRAGLDKQTPETYVLILSVPKQFSFLGADLLMNLYSKIKEYSDELYILIKKEIASYKVIKSKKDKTLIKEGNLIEEELNKICENLLPNIPEVDQLESLASAEMKKNQKLAYLFLKELSESPESKPRKFEISVDEDRKKEDQEDRAVFVKPIIIKSIKTIDNNNKLELTLKNQSKNLRDIRIQISRVQEFFETSSWETSIDIWLTNEELVFTYPISNEDEKFQVKVENKQDSTKLLSKEIVAKDYIQKVKPFFDTIAMKDFMDKNPVTISSSENIKNAVSIMNENKIDYIILTLDEKPIGIITHRDILKTVLPMMIEHNIKPENIKCKSVMSTPLQSVKKDDNIRKAALIILQTGVKKLPVLEDSKLIGIVRTNDLINIYLNQQLKDPDLEKKYKEIAHLNKYPVERIMNRKVVILDIERADLLDVINVMNERKIGSVLVSTGGERCGKDCGIITERNILKRIIEYGKDPREITLKELMSSPLITIYKDEIIEKAIQTMVNKGIRYLVVMDKDNPEKVEGIISNTDILNLDISKVSPEGLDISQVF